MIHPRLDSLDAHLRFGPGVTIETRELADTTGGLYPCYYRRLPDRLAVATSAAALIAAARPVEEDPDFRPPEYLLGDTPRQRFVRTTGAFPKALKESARLLLPDALLRRLSRNRFWYESWATLDRRVMKLRPFERVTPAAAETTFRPDFALRGADELVERVAAHMAEFVREIEDRFPDRHHVMMIGGRDSQLLALVPKRRPERWHAFSAAPNRGLVWSWMGWTGVEVGRVFGHDNRNEETVAETERKIVCGDLYSDPRHMRWLPALQRIAASFEGQCIFWAGSAGDALHIGRAHHRRTGRADPARFYDIHLARVPCLVGNYHQVVKNFTGCPLLSPYHSPAIWREVYSHHGPAVIEPGVDLRPRIAERLAGRPIRWPDRNPAPAPYRYERPFACLDLYRRRIESAGPGWTP